MIQVSETVFWERDTFLAALATGALLFFVYDLLRVIRRLIPHGTVWIALEDLVFWLGSALVIFAMLYREADGSIRGFAIGGVVMGMLLYGGLFSSLVVKGCVFVLERLLYVLLRPWVLLWHLVRRPLSWAGKKAGKARGFLKKRLKILWKAVRIGLCRH